MAEAEPGERALVVLAAPAGGPMAGVREVLHDWSAGGLIGEYLWLELPAAQPVNGSTPRAVVPTGLLVGDGDAVPTELQELLATRRLDRIRLCVLVPVTSPAGSADDSTGDSAGQVAVISADDEDRLAELIALARGPARLERLRCVITRQDAATGAATLAREGWHNLVVSPEDAAGPGLGHRVLAATDDPLAVGPPAAAALAGLTGLWLGVPGAPLDDEPILPGQTVRVARGYYRQLDATAVQQAVRTGVFSVRSGLPRPRTGTGRAVTIDDTAAATESMARQLWGKHRGVLRGPRVQPPAAVASKVGPLQAIRMLFGFIWATVRNAPMSWYRTMINKVASRTASAVQSGVFGREPSSYEVVVRGLRPDGSPADWRELSAASGRLEDALVQTGQLSQPTRPDLSPLWRDYVSAALTLADAGDRGRSGLPPIQVGTELGVIRRTADIAPGPDTRYTELPPEVAAEIDPGSAALHPADVLGAYTAEQRLGAAGDLGGDRALSGLRAWTSRWQHTFAHRVGARLATAILDTQQEIRELAAALGQAAESSETEDETRLRQRRLGRLMRILLIVFVIIEAVLFLLRWLDWIDWSVVAFAGVGALIGWLIGSFVIFVRNQQALFAELNRRRAISSQAEAHRQNLAHATRDLRRLTEAYDQFLAWSRVLGVALTEPFGRDEAAAGDHRPPADGLPLSVRIGAAVEQPEVIAEATERARRQLFPAGWLTAGPHAPWTRLLGDAAHRLGPRAMDLRDDPQRMFAEGSDPESLLRAWADELERGGVGSAGGDWYWQRIADGLNRSELSAALVSRVLVEQPGGGPRELDWAEFAANLDPDRDGAAGRDVGDGALGAGQTFIPGVFGPQARVAGRHRVARSWYRSSNRGLSRTAVLVQLSEGLAGYDLAFAGDVAVAQQQWQPPNADSVF